MKYDFYLFIYFLQKRFRTLLQASEHEKHIVSPGGTRVFTPERERDVAFRYERPTDACCNSNKSVN